MALKRKIAVIGTGAAGLGALQAILSDPGDKEVFVFDAGEPLAEPLRPPLPTREQAEAFYDGIYAAIRSAQPRKFPPPKTHFSKPLPRYSLEDKPGLFRSQSVGGLTNFWGGTMLPFTDKEFEPWPLDRKTMDPFYREMAEVTGIAGRSDALNRYFGECYSNRPPLRLTPMLDRLDRVINAGEARGGFELASGVNRCTLETREGHEQSCIYCGECLCGCFLGAVYSTGQTMARFFHDPRVTYVKARVERVDPEDRSIRCHGQDETYTDFSQVFLCAGCPGTTEIVMRSMDLSRVSEMEDNAVYVFPILYLGTRADRAEGDPYLSLSNLIVGCLPRAEGLRFAQVQVYPNFDYLWRYNLPARLWSLLRRTAPFFRARLFWGRLYVDGRASQAYTASLGDGGIRFEYARRADPAILPALMQSIRSAVCREGFHIPVPKPILQKTNSHYASTLPYGGARPAVSSRGEIAPGLFLCDSACFPELPAVSLTFTIMANACRTAREALDE